MYAWIAAKCGARAFEYGCINYCRLSLSYSAATILAGSSHHKTRPDELPSTSYCAHEFSARPNLVSTAESFHSGYTGTYMLHVLIIFLCVQVHVYAM